MRLPTTFILLFAIGLAAMGQPVPKKPLTFYPTTSVAVDSRYTDSTGVDILIHNSLPKGNGALDATGKKGYIRPDGKTFGYVVFWNRFVNETTTPLELTINFPADSFAISTSSGSYLKLFLPPDTMTLAKQQLYNYGITDLKSFLDANFHKPTMLQTVIDSRGEYLFHVTAVFYHTQGVARAEFILKEKNIFYKISIGGYSTLIPCGQIVLQDK